MAVVLQEWMTGGKRRKSRPRRSNESQGTFVVLEDQFAVLGICAGWIMEPGEEVVIIDTDATLVKE